MFTSLISAFLIFALFLLLQIIFYGFFKWSASASLILRSILYCSMLLPVAILLIHGLDSQDENSFIFFFIFSLLIYFLGWVIYLQCYYFIERSPTLRILTHFLDSSNHTLTFDQIEKNYNFCEVLQRRWEQMIEKGLLEPSKISGQIMLRNTQSGQLIANITLHLKLFMNLGEGG